MRFKEKALGCSQELGESGGTQSPGAEWAQPWLTSGLTPGTFDPATTFPAPLVPGPKPVPGSVTTRSLGRGSRVPSRTPAPEPLPAFKGPSARGARAWGRARSGRRGGSRREASAQPPLSARGVFSKPPEAEVRNPRRLRRLCPSPGLRFPVGAKRAAGRMRRQSPPRRHRPAAIPTSPGSGCASAFRGPCLSLARF